MALQSPEYYYFTLIFLICLKSTTISGPLVEFYESLNMIGAALPQYCHNAYSPVIAPFPRPLAGRPKHLVSDLRDKNSPETMRNTASPTGLSAPALETVRLG
jgi:hypothetical protein